MLAVLTSGFIGAAALTLTELGDPPLVTTVPPDAMTAGDGATTTWPPLPGGLVVVTTGCWCGCSAPLPGWVRLTIVASRWTTSD